MIDPNVDIEIDGIKVQFEQSGGAGDNQSSQEGDVEPDPLEELMKH
jgi:hypothetical protein